ncbi:MAG TPA: hypothetical protein VN437_06065, partial [Rectinemataceae bacterium]|nr:hypothetical protein [Rectinemataceae bacterium]
MSIGSKEEKERRIALGMGVVMVVVGFGATFLNWRSALTEGRFDGDEAIGGPLAGFIGLVLLLPSAEDADDGRRKL